MPQDKRRTKAQLLSEVEELRRRVRHLEESEAKQQRVEERLRLLGHTVESISEMVTVTDLEDRFTFVNQAFLQRYGYTREELLGQHVKVLWSPSNPLTILERIPQETRRGGWRGEILNLDKEGNEFPVALSTSVLRDEQGNLLGLVGVSEDITERRHAEQRISAYVNLGQKLSQAANSKEAAKVIIDTADQMLGWDSCFLISYWPEEDRVHPILGVDIIEGKRVASSDYPSPNEPGPLVRKTISEGKLLILRTGNHFRQEVNQPEFPQLRDFHSQNYNTPVAGVTTQGYFSLIELIRL